MIEKPAIEDEKIIAVLNQDYSIQVRHLEFLPVGNDASAFSYRVETDDHIYFLKLKTDLSSLAGLFVSRFLKDQGIQQIVAPLPTKAQKLFGKAGPFSIILYPFIVGHEAMQVGMSDSQWREFGSVLKQIHGTELPTEISQHVRREMFVPQWSGVAKELHKQVNLLTYDDPYQKELAIYWKEHSKTIQALIDQAEQIGRHLQQINLPFVLCHADIHTANMLLTSDPAMFIVDWDDTLFAPKERDLMFVFGGDDREEQLFFDGYGNVEINQLVLAYYRYEWCVQEIGDYGQRVFWTKDAGETTKQNSLDGFIELFLPGDVVETALNTPFELEIRKHS